MRPSVVQVAGGGRGAGAGIVWREDSILTNYHVVAHTGGKVEVLLEDDRLLDARVVAHEPPLDLALLEVEARGLTPAVIGDSGNLRVGDLVFAVGHPWGQRSVVTAGIISGLGTLRVRGGEGTSPYIRSNVRMAPGNSGGPLLDAQGAVVGINSMIFGGDLAISIPSSVAAGWVEGLRRRRIVLDMEVQPVPLPSYVFPENTRKRAAGLLVTAAPKETLFVGDVLLEVGGQPVENLDALQEVLAHRGNSARVPLRLLRGGIVETFEIDARLLERQA
ncbi:MAG: S1C family serine protease [Ardenticatenaceae bacterium]